MKSLFGFHKRVNEGELAAGEGSASLTELATLDSSEFNSLDKITQLKGVEVFQEMSYDEQVKFCLTVKKLLILSEGWEIVPADETPVAKEQSDFIQYNFDNLSHSFGSVLYQLMSALDYGFSVAEILWRKNDEVYPQNYLLKDFKVKFPWDCDFFYDEFGNLNKLEIKNKEMPLNKFIIFSYNEQFGNKSGESDLKACYNAWWFKTNIWKFWSRHLERFGSPIVKGHVPPGATTDETNKFFAIINRLHHIVGVILPRKNTGEEFDFELVESKREGGRQFSEAMENVDGRISRGLLMPRLLGATKEVFGSYALGVEQFKMFYKIFLFIANNFSEEVINRQVIKQTIDYNFPVRLYPKFKIKPISAEYAEAVLKEVKKDGSDTPPSEKEEPEPKEEIPPVKEKKPMFPSNQKRGNR